MSGAFEYPLNERKDDGTFEKLPPRAPGGYVDAASEAGSDA
jgi:hypothetical protein